MAYESKNDYTTAIENYEKFMSISTDDNMKSQVKAQVDYLKSKQNETKE